MEDNIPWKTTFYGRQPLMESIHRSKTTLRRKQLSMEDNLQLKRTLDERGPTIIQSKPKNQVADLKSDTEDTILV